MKLWRCRVCQPSATPIPGAVYAPRWSGTCPLCDCQMTLVEIEVDDPPAKLVHAARAIRKGGPDASDELESEEEPPSGPSDVALILEQLRQDAVAAANQDDGDDEASQPVRAVEMKSPKPVKRLPSGERALDAVLGGGWARGQAYALHGAPGAGKGRLIRFAASLCCRHGNVMIASSKDEEKSEMVLFYLKTGSHEGVPYMKQKGADRIILLPNASNVDKVIDVAVANNVVLLFADSLPTMHTRRPGVGRQPENHMRYSGRLFRGVAEAFDMTIVTTMHVTNDGIAAGGRFLGHLFEAVLRMTRVRPRERIIDGYPHKIAGQLDEWTEGDDGVWEGLTRLSNDKNRFCPPGRMAVFEQADAGLIPRHEYGKYGESNEAKRSAAAGDQGSSKAQGARTTRSRA